ncbi:hypothetical protein BN1013_01354 [Candidatus Rubidus massiliensis]|nr:hypothetical protein BN1013_01354 [Candidatus Rubidus massiliensis]
MLKEIESLPLIGIVPCSFHIAYKLSQLAKKIWEIVKAVDAFNGHTWGSKIKLVFEDPNVRLNYNYPDDYLIDDGTDFINVKSLQLTRIQELKNERDQLISEIKNLSLTAIPVYGFVRYKAEKLTS